MGTAECDGNVVHAVYLEVPNTRQRHFSGHASVSVGSAACAVDRPTSVTVWVNPLERNTATTARQARRKPVDETFLAPSPASS
jgi:hypothetical protein